MTSKFYGVKDKNKKWYLIQEMRHARGTTWIIKTKLRDFYIIFLAHPHKKKYINLAEERIDIDSFRGYRVCYSEKLPDANIPDSFNNTEEIEQIIKFE